MTPRKRMRAPRQARGSIQLGLDPEDWLEAEAIVQQRHAVPPGERSDFL